MNWSAMLRTGAALGVGPEAFWRLSLKEWRWLTETPGTALPMGRGELETMATRWPDSPSTASRSPSPSLRDREES
jgi:uncharacterized phage protein (TIGR02216 family)